MKYLIITISLLSLHLFTSCFKDEDPYPREKIPEGVQINSVSVDEYYSTQIYFELKSNSVVKSNSIKDWDLGFSCKENEYYIFVNPATMSAVANLGKIDFDSNISAPPSSSKIWKWDEPNGDITRTAIGSWGNFSQEPIVSKKYVYVVDLGTDELGKPLGKRKLMIDKFENNHYFITYADLDGGNKKSIQIPKDPEVNCQTFSFNNGVNFLEPKKDNWDLLFSRSRETLVTSDGDSVQYTVVGTYLNPNFVMAVQMDSSYKFESLELKDIEPSILSPKRNVIGHDWKWYNIDEGYYTVRAERVYVIKNVNGDLYKLRFLSFLNDKGKKGFPKFEFQKLF